MLSGEVSFLLDEFEPSKEGDWPILDVFVNVLGLAPAGYFSSEDLGIPVDASKSPEFMTVVLNVSRIFGYPFGSLTVNIDVGTGSKKTIIFIIIVCTIAIKI